MKLAAPVYADGLRKSTQVRFGGYEALGKEGALRDMKNLTSDYVPELASREPRKIAGTVTSPRGLLGGERLIWLDGRDMHIGTAEGETVVSDIIPASEGTREIAVIGDYVTIWPDKVWYDIIAGTHGSLEAEASGTAEFCSEASPDGLSDTCNCMKLADASVLGFKPGDGVSIAGCAWRKENNRDAVVKEVSGDALYFYDNTLALDRWLIVKASKAHAAGTYRIEHDELPQDYKATLPEIPENSWMEIALDRILNGVAAELAVITASGLVCYTLTAATAGIEALGENFIIEDRDYTESGTVTVKRSAPELEFVFEHANRLWGCVGATIYASALGDPFNWNVYDGTASDSWAADTGSGGSFTGAISYGGYPRFFKEERIYTLYGDIPEEYQLMEHNYLGVHSGSERSLAIVNGLLFYLSKAGPCIFQGGAPAKITDAFGTMRYKNGVGGTEGTKYYLSAQDENGAWHLFNYDTGKSLWFREDNMHAVGMATYNTDLYAIDAEGTMVILGRPRALPGWAAVASEGVVDWMAEFGDITQNSPNRKRITKVQLRLSLETGTTAKVSICYDSKEWREIAEIEARRQRSVVLPVIPHRPDHFRLKIEGKGPARISSLAIETAVASDRR